MHFHDKPIENETIELTPSKDIHILGPDLTLVRSTLILRVSARAMTFTRVRFLECTIEAKIALSDFHWLDSFLSGCTFKGRFNGSDFGNWPSHFDPDGGIEHCDFTGATLDGCRFIGCDPSTIRFPAWPCFTILDPVGRLEELRALDWPGDADILVDTMADFPETTAAVTYFADAVEKELDADKDVLRELLASLEGVVA